MTELQLPCSVDPKTDYIIIRKCKDGEEMLPNIIVYNEVCGQAAVVLTLADTLLLKQKLEEILS